MCLLDPDKEEMEAAEKLANHTPFGTAVTFVIFIACFLCIYFDS